MENEIKSRNKSILLKIAFIFTALLIVITIFGIWGLKPLLSNRIKNAILTSTNHLYQIDFKDIKYNFVTGNAQVIGVKWMADSSLFDELKKAEKLPNTILKCRVDVIELAGLRPWTIIFSKKLNLSGINITDPFIEIVHEKQPFNKAGKSKSPYQIISKFVSSFSVDKIKINNINFNYTNLSKTGETQKSQIQSLDVEVSDLLIDSVAHKDKERFYYAKECRVKLKKIAFPSADSLNILHLDELEFSTKKRSLDIKKIAFEPQYKPLDYGNHSGGDDRLEAKCDSLSLSEKELTNFEII